MARRSSGLGRGLDAIFLDNTIAENTTSKENTINTLKISLIDPKSDQPISAHSISVKLLNFGSFLC